MAGGYRLYIVIGTVDASDIKCSNGDLAALLIKSYEIYDRLHPPILGLLSDSNVRSDYPPLIPDTLPQLEGDLSLVEAPLVSSGLLAAASPALCTRTAAELARCHSRSCTDADLSLHLGPVE